MMPPEYGSLALLGVAVPQANPTVEPEMAALVPDGVALLATRLHSTHADSRTRLVDYLDQFPNSLDAFDTAPLAAVGFACTGTSYLVGQQAETRRLSSMAMARGIPLISAAQAIRRALDVLGARKVALFAPYPDWLAEASLAYWTSAGLAVVARAGIPIDTADTRKVYQAGSAMVQAQVSGMGWQAADAILLTGTGVATLRAIPGLVALTGKPVLSSNLCLAWALLDTLGLGGSAPYLHPATVQPEKWLPYLRA